MRGAVTETLAPDSAFVDAKNDPMQPLAWLHPYTAPNGKVGTTFCTTMGSSVDLVSEDLRRMLVNAAYFLTGQKVPENADVSYVDPFYPSFYGFIREKEHWPSLNMQPKDYGLGKSPAAPEPKVLRSGSTATFLQANKFLQGAFDALDSDACSERICSASFRYLFASRW